MTHKKSNNERKQHKSLVKHVLYAIARNALYAAIGRILFGVLKRLGKGGLRIRVIKQLSGEIFSLDPLRWAFLLGGLSSFRLVKEILSVLCHYFGITEKLASVLAGCICALPSLAMNRETRTDLSLYVFVRALHSFSVGYILPILPEPCRRFEHYDIITMCLSASQILYSVIFAPFTMPPAYQRFLLKAAMLDNRVVRGHAGLARYQITPELVELCVEKGFKIPQSAKEHFKIGCLYSHPGMTCNRFFFSFLMKQILWVGMPLYVPLKLGAIIAFKRNDLKHHPLKVLQNMLRSALLSALFLALYSASTVRFACFAAQGNIRGGFFFAIMCSLAGVATLLEPKGRRMDLALYCLTYALRSFVMTQYRLGRIPYPRHDTVFLLYLFSVGFIFYQYDREPEKLNSGVRANLAKLLMERDVFRSRSRKNEGSTEAEVKSLVKLS
ncbi:uncharacterized protein TM35_000033960 [Trypanosoma theileri]|uniref:Transmembrane protein 135 N-terminal domain-containing protein n=1 Tax=Trypanosoma theileri TaxID=67003 RepID=A0A1X0P7N6_9TRYP|nr:uncharacterized protein TM35_000033960 [Trypanosoma theileri]ORC92643.1 hypothetical protein TM35_000033960 [Trypanosoma theileri]